jgi:hypothetical protein
MKFLQACQPATSSALRGNGKPCGMNTEDMLINPIGPLSSPADFKSTTRFILISNAYVGEQAAFSQDVRLIKN